ncbi:MAG: S-layer protein [Candidatus Micrarchaeia archaeon]
MKGLNVTKIAALAAGAALLGASVVAADVTYGNTQIINQNGVPVVKIAVGAKAAASDGVAAANIAAMIGNLAYTQRTITAEVQGTATCSVTGGGAGAGTCPVSNEKVTLNVTIPGTVTGATGFKTLITDWVDKKLQNRNNTDSDDVYNATNDPEIFTTTQAIKKITGSEFAPLATSTVRDSYASTAYTEEQQLWVTAQTKYESSLKQVVATAPYAAYRIEFTHDQYGIPVCTSRDTSSGSDGSKGDWTDCATDTDRTDRHRVQIDFLGSKWIISEMTPPSENLSSSTANITGGSIKLAKESAYGIVHIGENLTAGAYTIKLADITVPLTADEQAYASIEIYDVNGVLLKEDQIAPSSTYTWNAPDGTKVRIRVYKTNPGYTLQAKWAEMAVYSQEIELISGDELNDDNEDWDVVLYWKNKDYSTTNNDPSPDCLKAILIRNEATENALLNLQKGDTFNIVSNPSVWQLQYDGLTLSDSDYDSVSLVIVRPTSLVISQSLSPAGTDCSNTTTLSNPELLHIKSGQKEAFTVNGYPTSTFFYDLQRGRVYYQPAGETACYYNVSASGITYDPGDGDQPLTIERGLTNHVISVNVTFREDAGNNQYDYYMLHMTNKTLLTYRFNSTTEIYYTDTGNADNAPTTELVAEGHISERGSVFVAVDTDSASFKMAKKVAEAQYYVKSTGQAVGESVIITLAEGETSSTLSGGVVIQAVQISETVGACTATGGQATCSVDMSPVSAVPSVTKATVITPLNTKTDPLVLLDSQALGTTATIIAVGGPEVNEVTKQAIAAMSTPIDFNTERVVVRETGNKIIVAGLTAQDTITAANQFIEALAAARPA